MTTVGILIPPPYLLTSKVEGFKTIIMNLFLKFVNSFRKLPALTNGLDGSISRKFLPLFLKNERTLETEYPLSQEPRA